MSMYMQYAYLVFTCWWVNMYYVASAEI